MRKLLSILLPALLLFACSGQKSVLLRYDLEKDDSFKSTMTTTSDVHFSVMGQSVDVKTVAAIELLSEVVGVEGEDYMIDLTYENVKMDMSAPMAGMSISTNTAEKPADDSKEYMMMYNMNRAMVGKTLSMVVSNRGEVKDVTGFDSLFDGLFSSLKEGDEEIQSEEIAVLEAQMKELMKSSFGKESFISNYNISSILLPVEPVKKGDKWTQTIKYNASLGFATDVEYTFKGTKGDHYLIEATSGLNIDLESLKSVMPGVPVQMELDGEGKFEILVNKETGWNDVSKIEIKMEGEMNIDNQKETVSMPIVVKTTIETKVHN